MKKYKKIALVLTLAIMVTLALGTTAYAAPTGDVAWKDASGQIKTVVNNVVFPAIDLILAVFFFAKLAMAYFDCAPVTAM